MGSIFFAEAGKQTQLFKANTLEILLKLRGHFLLISKAQIWVLSAQKIIRWPTYLGFRGHFGAATWSCLANSVIKKIIFCSFCELFQIYSGFLWEWFGHCLGFRWFRHFFGLKKQAFSCIFSWKYWLNSSIIEHFSKFLTSARVSFGHSGVKKVILFTLPKFFSGCLGNDWIFF